MEIVQIISTANYADMGPLLYGWKSLIWTERWQEPDSFEIRYADIGLGKQNFPIGGMFTLLDTQVLMRVESHLIELNEEGDWELVISGRGLESILQYRDLLSDYAKTRSDLNYSWVTRINNGARNQICKAIAANLLVTATPYSGSAGTVNDPDDLIPNAVVTNYHPGTPVATKWGIPPIQSKWDYIFPLLQDYNLGLKCRRPIGDSVERIYPTVSPSFDGTVNVLTFTNVNKLEFYFYQATDRSATVIFAANDNDFTNERYLDSNLGTATGILMSTSLDGIRRTYDPSKTGFDRRWLYVDATNQSAPASASAADKADMATALLRQAYNANRYRLAFDGDLGPAPKFKYNKDYFVGDIIGFQGKYGYRSNMRVTEYSRIQDDTGYIEYPTFEPVL